MFITSQFHHNHVSKFHCNDVKWAQWSLKSPATTRVFTQQFIQTNNKENPKAPHHKLSPPMWRHKTFFINSVRFWKCAFIYSFLISTYTLINHLYPEKCTRVYVPKSAIQAIMNNCNQQLEYCYVISYLCPRWPVAYSLHENLSYDIIIYFNFTTWFPGVKDPDVCIIKIGFPNLLHKSHIAPVPYPTMHHFVTEMCTCVHISVTKLRLVGYLSDALWDFLDDWFIT